MVSESKTPLKDMEHVNKTTMKDDGDEKRRCQTTENTARTMSRHGFRELVVSRERKTQTACRLSNYSTKELNFYSVKPQPFRLS